MGGTALSKEKVWKGKKTVFRGRMGDKMTWEGGIEGQDVKEQRVSGRVI